MNTTIVETTKESIDAMPGSQLADIREAKGFSREYVAGKLHLRVKVIELLENDDYQNMPEPVFIKGYLRAYAKLMDTEPEPLLEAFNHQCHTERKLEKALWQTRRPSNGAEYAIKWLTVAIAAGVIIAVSLWWHKSKDNNQLFSSGASRHSMSANQSETEVRLTDLSKMRSLLSSKTQYSTLEK